MIDVDPEIFEQRVEEAFKKLPDKFRKALDNIGVFVEDYPDEEVVRTMRLRSKHHLLGLYQGVPLTGRGTWYGATPTAPDKITLYRRNILTACAVEEDVDARIYEVLVHEIGHYFGMTDREIRKAGY